MTNLKKSSAKAQATPISTDTPAVPTKSRSQTSRPNTRLSRVITKLGEARRQSAKAYEQYKAHKEIEDALREELMATLRVIGLRAAKGDDYTASIAERPTIVVKHEPSVIEWLKHAPDVESDVYIGLKLTAFQTLAKHVLKTTGEVIPGTELEVHESLSIKSNKKG